MSVIGIDFGGSKQCVASVERGGIDIILNAQSERFTATAIGFGGRQRFVGYEAENQQRNVINDLKRRITTCDADENLIEFEYAGEMRHFQSVQLLAGFFSQAKEISLKKQNTTGSSVTPVECVITVPSFFNDQQRRMVMMAADVANVKCLCLLNEGTAAAFAYGISQTPTLPPDGSTEEPPRRVVFVDVGAFSTQLTLVAFTKNKMKVMAHFSDPQLGGTTMDYVLFEYFSEDFAKKYRIDVSSRKKQSKKLLNLCAKTRKLMSTNANVIPLNIECFWDDRDVSSSIKRETFEKFCEDAGLLARFRKVFSDMHSFCASLTKSSDNSSATVCDSVEIIGGCTRTPFIKSMVQEVFGIAPTTLLNADEAVAKGAALHAAMLSPKFKIRTDFGIAGDVQAQDVSVYWESAIASDACSIQSSKIFSANSTALYQARLVTFFRDKPDFIFDIRYGTSKLPNESPLLGRYRVSGIDVSKTCSLNQQSEGPTDQPDTQLCKVKVKIRCDTNGVFSVTSAQQFVPPPPESEQMDTNEAKQNGEAAKDGETPAAEQPVKKPAKWDTIDLKVELIEVPDFHPPIKTPDSPVEYYMKVETEILAANKSEAARADSMNRLEEIILDWKHKLDPYECGQFKAPSMGAPADAKLADRLAMARRHAFDLAGDSSDPRNRFFISSKPDVIKGHYETLCSMETWLMNAQDDTSITTADPFNAEMEKLEAAFIAGALKRRQAVTKDLPERLNRFYSDCVDSANARLAQINSRLEKLLTTPGPAGSSDQEALSKAVQSTTSTSQKVLDAERAVTQHLAQLIDGLWANPEAWSRDDDTVMWLENIARDQSATTTKVREAIDATEKEVKAIEDERNKTAKKIADEKKKAEDEAKKAEEAKNKPKEGDGGGEQKEANDPNEPPPAPTDMDVD